MKSMRLIAVALVALAAGCASPPRPAATPEPMPAAMVGVMPAEYEGAVRRYVVAGLTKVDPAFYRGWAGACPGADVDATRVVQYAASLGIDGTLLRDLDATKAAFLGAIWREGGDLEPNDLLVVFYSGHGGQVKDFDGDEATGLDSTFCLADGAMTDDDFAAMLEHLQCRVLVIADACNSGTIARAPVTFDGVRIPTNFDGQLILISGCNDGEYSYGSTSGGVLTTALFSPPPGDIANLAWFEVAARKMARSQDKQVPRWSEYNGVGQAFRMAPVFK